MNPALTNNEATSAVLLIFSTLLSGIKSKSRLSPCLKLSPSKEKYIISFKESFFSTSFAIVLLPEPDNPVNHKIPGL